MLNLMSDEHLFAYLHATRYQRNSTAAELELIKRYDALLEQKAALEAELAEAQEQADKAACAMEDMDEHLITDHDNTMALLRVLVHENIETPCQLKCELARAAQYQASNPY